MAVLQIGVLQYNCSAAVVKILKTEHWRSSYFVKLQVFNLKLN